MALSQISPPYALAQTKYAKLRYAPSVLEAKEDVNDQVSLNSLASATKTRTQGPGLYGTYTIYADQILLTERANFMLRLGQKQLLTPQAISP